MSRTALVRLAAVFALIATGVVASPARNSIADVVGGALGIHGAKIVPTNPHNPANALVAATVPQLTATQESTAVRLASEDKYIAHLLHSMTYQVAHVGPWNTEHGGRLIGVVLFVSLAHPTTLAGMWPTAVYEPAERKFPPYTERRIHFTATGVRSLLIEVDLNRGLVAGVMPSDYTSISPRPS